jgi:hypothetical protein
MRSQDLFSPKLDLVLFGTTYFEGRGLEGWPRRGPQWLIISSRGVLPISPPSAILRRGQVIIVDDQGVVYATHHNILLLRMGMELKPTNNECHRK